VEIGGVRMVKWQHDDQLEKSIAHSCHRPFIHDCAMNGLLPCDEAVKMTFPVRPEKIIGTAEAFDDSAPADSAHRWVYGIAVPLLMAGLVLWGVVRGTVPFPGGRPARIVWYEGASAKLILLGFFGMTLFTHFHYFWSGHPRFHTIGYLGKVLSLVMLCGAIIAFVYRVLVLG
jgi:hypothetical protein